MPLFFANTNLFRDMVHRRVAESPDRPYWVLIAAEPITDVDTTAAEMLVDLDEDLNAHNIHLVFAELKDPVKDNIIRYGLLESIDRQHFFPTLGVAVEAFEHRNDHSTQSVRTILMCRVDEDEGRTPELLAFGLRPSSSHAVPPSNAFKPAAAWYFPLYLWFGFCALRAQKPNHQRR